MKEGKRSIVCLPYSKRFIPWMASLLLSSELDQLLYDTIEKAASVVVLPIVRFESSLDHITSFAITISNAVSCETKIPLETIVHSLY